MVNQIVCGLVGRQDARMCNVNVDWVASVFKVLDHMVSTLGVWRRTRSSKEMDWPAQCVTEICDFWITFKRRIQYDALQLFRLSIQQLEARRERTKKIDKHLAL